MPRDFKPIQPDKGERDGSCNARNCQRPGATWFNCSNRAYYCPDCARRMNDATRSWAWPEYKHDLCVAPWHCDYPKVDSKGEGGMHDPFIPKRLAS